MAIFSARDALVRGVSPLSQFYQLTPEEIDKWALLMEPVFSQDTTEKAATWDKLRKGDLNYSQGDPTRKERLEPLYELHAAARFLMDVAAGKRTGCDASAALSVLNDFLKAPEPGYFLVRSDAAWRETPFFRAEMPRGEGPDRLLSILLKELTQALTEPGRLSICPVCSSVFYGNTERRALCSSRCQTRNTKRKRSEEKRQNSRFPSKYQEI